MSRLPYIKRLTFLLFNKFIVVINMNIYEEMWKLFINKIVMAKTHSLEQEVKYDTIIELLRLIETSNVELIQEYQKEKEDKEIKDETGLDPL